MFRWGGSEKGFNNCRGEGGGTENGGEAQEWYWDCTCQKRLWTKESYLWHRGQLIVALVIFILIDNSYIFLLLTWPIGDRRLTVPNGDPTRSTCMMEDRQSWSNIHGKGMSPISLRSGMLASDQGCRSPIVLDNIFVHAIQKSDLLRLNKTILWYIGKYSQGRSGDGI